MQQALCTTVDRPKGKHCAVPCASYPEPSFRAVLIEDAALGGSVGAPLSHELLSCCLCQETNLSFGAPREVSDYRVITQTTWHCFMTALATG